MYAESIKATHDEVNQASFNILPPWLPEELRALKIQYVVQIVLHYQDRLVVYLNKMTLIK